MWYLNKCTFHRYLSLLSLSQRLSLCSSACVSLLSSYVCRKAPCCASERNSPKTGSLSCRCWKDILTLFDFWCRLMTSGKQTTTPPPSSFLFFFSNLSPLYPWLASIPLWLTGDPHLQKTYRAWQEPNHHHYVIVCAVQYTQSPLMLSVHTCTHTSKGSAPDLSSAALWEHAAHIMVEWVCISAQIGIYNRTKYVCVGLVVCVCQEGGAASRLVSPSNNLLLWVSSSPLTGPQSGAKGRKFSPDCFWSPKMYPRQFLSSHFFLSGHPVCWFWERVVWMLEGQRASGGGNPRTDVYFKIPWEEMELQQMIPHTDRD